MPSFLPLWFFIIPVLLAGWPASMGLSDWLERDAEP